MTEAQAIEEALKLLRTGQFLDVPKAIEVLLTAQNKICRCETIELCNLHDKCMRVK